VTEPGGRKHCTESVYLALYMLDLWLLARNINMTLATERYGWWKGFLPLRCEVRHHGMIQSLGFLKPEIV